MSAHAVITAAALAAAPVPASTYEHALELYDKKAYLEAADAAVGGYVAPGPAAERLQNARLAQEAFSKAYETSAGTTGTTGTTTPRPEYLCRALDVLDATAPLAIEGDDVRLHTVLAEELRAKLAAHHPSYPCDVGTEFRPILAISREHKPPRLTTPASLPKDPPGAEIRDQTRKIPSPKALKLAGAVSISLGVVALAASAAGLTLRSQVSKVAALLDGAKDRQEGELRPQQALYLTTLAATDNAGRQLALAGGISGAFLVVIGAALIGRGHRLDRARVAPMAGLGRAGLFVEGRF